MTRENAKRKIVSCLNLAAPKSGATDGERETAKAMAAKLMLQHGIEAAELRGPAPERRAPPPPQDYGGVVIVVNLGGFQYGFQGFSARSDFDNTTTGF